MSSRLYSRRLMKRRHKPYYGRGRAKRPKTFKTEEKAKEHAKQAGISNFKITKLHEGKFRIDEAE